MAKKKETKEEAVATWIKRIQAARLSREKEKDTHGWDRFIEEYEGKYQLGIQSNVMRLPIINLVYGYVHTEIPKLYMRDPYITVNPKGKDFIQRARVLENSVNYLISQIGLKGEVDKIIMDALIVGHGWIKLGYSGDFDKLDLKGIEHTKDGDKEIKDQLVTVNHEEIFALYVPWNEILIDPLAKDAPSDSTWIVHSFIRPLDYVKNSGLYENTAGLKSNVSLKSKDSKLTNDVKQVADDVELVQMHEVWDIPSGRIMTLSEDHEKFLRNIKNDYEMDGLPFEKLYFNRTPKPGTQYPISDIEVIEPQIMERIKLRAAMINHVKRWNRQISIEKGSHDKEELQKLELGLDGSVIQRNPKSAPPTPMQYSPFQNEAFVLDRLIMSDMDAVIGQSEAERGGAAKTETKTLGELQAQLAGSVSRSQKRVDVLEDFIERVCVKIIALMKQFFDNPRYVQITDMSIQEVLQAFGPKVAGTFDGTGIQFSKQDIQGEFDIEVKAGTTMPMTKQNRMSVMEMILNMLGKIPRTPTGIEIFKEILRDLNLKSAEKAFENEMQQVKPPASVPAQVPGLPPGVALPPGMPPPQARPAQPTPQAAPRPPMPAPGGPPPGGPPA